MWNKKRDVINFLFILFLIIVIGLMVYVEIQENNIEKYCEEQGWDGWNNMEGYKCYKNVPHPSGTGVVREYSGIIEVD